MIGAELLDRDREPLERVARAGALERVEEHAPAQPGERAEDAAASLRSSRARRGARASPPTSSMNSSSSVSGRRAPARSSSIASLRDQPARRRSRRCGSTAARRSRGCATSGRWCRRARRTTCSRSLIWREATASMPSNGSSRKSSRGAGSSAAASDSFLRMPCEKSVDQRRRRAARDPSASSRSPSAACAPSASSMPWTCATKLSVSRAVSRSNSARSSGTTPMRRLTATGSASGSMPRMRIDPARRLQQAGQALDGRRLAGAVRAEEAVEAAGAARAGRCRRRREVAERARQPARLDREIPCAVIVSVPSCSFTLRSSR